MNPTFVKTCLQNPSTARLIREVGYIIFLRRKASQTYVSEKSDTYVWLSFCSFPNSKGSLAAFLLEKECIRLFG